MFRRELERAEQEIKKSSGIISDYKQVPAIDGAVCAIGESFSILTDVCRCDWRRFRLMKSKRDALSLRSALS